MAGKNRVKSAKKGAKASTSKSKFDGIKRFVSDKRTKKVTGLLILFCSLLLLIALSSFIFTWKADQSMLSDEWSAVLSEGNYETQNLLGPLGAMAGHFFVYEWFGLMSYLIVLITFLIGFKVLFKKSLLPLGKTVLASIMAMVIFSPLLAFVFTSDSTRIIGGAFGYNLNHSLIGKIGSIGTGFFLVFASISYIIIAFNPSFKWVTPIIDKLNGINLSERFKRRADALDDEEEQEFHDTIGDMDNIQRTAADIAMSDEDVPDIPDEVVTKSEDKELSLETEVPMPGEPDKAGNDNTETNNEKDSDDGLALELEPVAPANESGKEEDSFSIEVPEKEKELSKTEINQKVADFGEYDPTLDLAKFKMPPIDLLEDHGGGKVTVSKEELEENKNKIVTTLSHYKIGIEKIKATIGPTVTLYEIVPEPGVRISKIKNLEDDIALSLAALGIRIIAPIPGKGTIGIEVPNSNPDIVSMRALLASEKFQNSPMELPIALGKTISNETFITDLAKMPHLLMAGATGQGKSVGLNAILVSLLYKRHPSQIKFVLVDPKKVELTLFNKIERHYLAKLPDEEDPIITDTSKVVKTLNSLCIEMDNRYELLKNASVRNIKEYNAKFIKRKLNPEKGHKFLPYIVLVVDEFADLIMTAGKEVETPIARLAQLARAIGIHLIIATQRPSVNIITGVIKANFPGRIAFRVSSKIDSRTILDAGGADQLIGRGDMLLSTGNDLTRIQCGFVDTPEVDEITEYIGNQTGYPSAFELPEYIGEEGGGSGEIDLGDRDALFEDAARVIVQNQQGSTSLIQRKLKLGYNRAGRIVDQLEAAGIVGPFEGSKARQVLIPDEYALEQLLNSESEKIEN